MQSMFSPELYKETRRPLHQASTLPGWCYVSPDWYAREITTMFLEDWLCVGREERIPESGDFFSIEVVGRPLIVVRDEAGEIRVHSAVCRHRGAVITTESGRCRTFVCPYHGWTYSLSGKLITTPGSPAPMAQAEDFSPADYTLASIRCDLWAGFIFITFNPHAQPLARWLGDLPDLVAKLDLTRMQWKHQDVFELECNWKVWIENAMENYHSWTVHRKHMNPVKSSYGWTYAKTNGPWEAMISKSSLAARTSLPGMNNLDEDSYHIWVSPNLKIIATSSSMKFRIHLPIGPEKLRVLENWAFPRGSSECSPDVSIVDQPYYKKYAQIIDEDIRINTNVQKGLRSGAYQPGRYAAQEHIVHRIANLVLDRVIGPDDGAARAERHGTSSGMTIGS